MNEEITNLIQYAINNNSIIASYSDNNFENKPLIQYVGTDFDIRDGLCYRITFVHDGGKEKIYQEQNDLSISDQLQNMYDWMNGVGK